MDLGMLLSEQGRVDPPALYARLHRDGVAQPVDGAARGFAAAVYGYEAVSQVLKDGRFRQLDADYLDLTTPQWRRHPALRVLRDSMFFTDGPAHDGVRQIIGRAFTARRVNALEGAVTELTHRLLDRLAQLAADGPVEFMGEFAYLLPSSVMAELLGVPQDDLAWFRPRVLAIGAILELDGANWRNMVRADTAARELSAYFTDLVALRRTDPRDDLISLLAATELSDEALVANLITTFNAGFVTTTHLLGNGLTMLLERPRLRAELGAGNVGSYVDEMLRFEPPVQILVRYAPEDAEIEGVPVPAGQAVLAMIGAANRDPARFADPDAFDPARPDPGSLSFGFGPHYCLGAALSRLEGQVAFPALFERFPDLALAQQVGNAPKPLILRGHDTLAVACHGR
ncbi:cytochrome P450 [Catellatospora methionotrophica]|uniref:Cytochrome P450 n=1 Tax=Catellatospora methionotrophica TaxID=121620 RepID=A0A8J3LH07_9ACTN|nr:cytochrome P450 [Catellatospora methionotrophica]GIG12435.1 cytochrome P450 [Catellatospora methionotrophica]